MAVSYLYASYGRDLLDLDLPFLRSLNFSDVEMVVQAMEKEINCPLTSGAGRLFDAVAAILDICKVSLFHAEAPMRLEGLARLDHGVPYPYEPGRTIDVRPMIREIVEDIKRGEDPGKISSRFHNTIAHIIVKMVIRIRKELRIKKVALSGGSFQNRILSTLVVNLLQEQGLTVFIPEMVPPNDGGIALGQLAVAAKRRKL